MEKNISVSDALNIWALRAVASYCAIIWKSTPKFGDNEEASADANSFIRIWLPINVKWDNFETQVWIPDVPVSEQIWSSEMRWRAVS